MLRACFNMSLLSFVLIGYGTAPNSRHTVAMSRRMSPILNGMETDKFKPDFSQEDRNPTSILLSHVYDLKGIHEQKNTIVLPISSLLSAFFSFSFFDECKTSRMPSMQHLSLSISLKSRVIKCLCMAPRLKISITLQNAEVSSPSSFSFALSFLVLLFVFFFIYFICCRNDCWGGTEWKRALDGVGQRSESAASRMAFPELFSIGIFFALSFICLCSSSFLSSLL